VKVYECGARRNDVAMHALSALLMVVTILQASPPIEPAPAPADQRAQAQQSMRDAAVAFLASLDDKARALATRPFDDPARRNWSYVRGDRAGLFLSDMTPVQRAKAMALADSALSDAGRERVRLVQAIEEINRADELARKSEPTCGSDRYAILVFGDPMQTPWGWRLEGHHIGLHFSSVAGDTTTTPLFFGSFPAALREGPGKGSRPLGVVQDAALELRRSLTAEQLKLATIGDTVPADVITGPGREASLREAPTQGGIMMNDLTASQRELLWGLVVRHALDLRGDLASDELRRIKTSGTERIRFGWAGVPQVDKPHYYRIAGPSFAMEFDCTQGNPDHVHCVWNDPDRNFGGDPPRDLLRDHVKEEQAPPPATPSGTSPTG